MANGYQTLADVIAVAIRRAKEYGVSQPITMQKSRKNPYGLGNTRYGAGRVFLRVSPDGEVKPASR